MESFSSLKVSVALLVQLPVPMTCTASSADCGKHDLLLIQVHVAHRPYFWTIMQQNLISVPAFFFSYAEN